MEHLNKLLNSFIYALRGIYYAFRYERNMRIHLVCMVYMYYFLFVYDYFSVSRTELAIILLANALVLSSELINTAIERAVDTATDSIKESAKISKDCAAGAVLISAIFAVGVGIAIFWQPKAFSALFRHYSEKPYMLIVFAASVIIFTLFIFSYDILDGKKKNER